MDNKEKLKEMYRQLDTTKNAYNRSCLIRGIRKLDKKMKKEKIGMSFKDGIYIAINKEGKS